MIVNVVHEKIEHKFDVHERMTFGELNDIVCKELSLCDCRFYDGDGCDWPSNELVMSWLSTLPDGRIYVGVVPSVENISSHVDVEWELWRIFSYHCVHGHGGVDMLVKQQFVQLLRESDVITADNADTLTRAEVDIIFVHECGKRLMGFEEFLGALVQVGVAFYSKKERYRTGNTRLYAQAQQQHDRTQCFHRLIREYVLPKADRWVPDDDSVVLRDDINGVFEHFRSFLVEVFFYYCGQAPRMQYSAFKRFTTDFDFGSIGLSSADVAIVFLMSKSMPVDGSWLKYSNRTKLELPEFVASLIRCAVHGFSKSSRAPPLDAVKALFMHMHQCKQFVKKEKITHRDGPSYHAKLLQSAFLTMWYNDDRKHYLAPKQLQATDQALSAMALQAYEHRRYDDDSAPNMSPPPLSSTSTTTTTTTTTRKNSKSARRHQQTHNNNAQKNSTKWSSLHRLRRHRKSSMPMMVTPPVSTSLPTPVSFSPSNSRPSSAFKSRPTSLSSRYRNLKRVPLITVNSATLPLPQYETHDMSSNDSNNENNTDGNQRRVVEQEEAQADESTQQKTTDDECTTSQRKYALDLSSDVESVATSINEMSDKSAKLIRSLRKTVMIGDTFVKYQSSRLGKSTVKYVQVAPDELSIWWDTNLRNICSARAKKGTRAKRCIRFDEIVHVKLGHHTATFSFSGKGSKDQVATRSFSIITADRSLDLVAETRSVAKKWVAYLKFRLNEVRLQQEDDHDHDQDDHDHDHDEIY